MNLMKIRAELNAGKSVYTLPLRVAFYARVSTDKYEQLSSLDNQVQYYTELINSKPDWTFTQGYIDEGLSGTSTKKRDSFNRMISDAKSGHFDLIITKEISRFSRSTLDSIKYTQELLEYNIGVFFQNDNINTLDSDSEFRLTVMAAVAQDEVRKLSDRLKFGFRQSIRNGRVLGNDSLWGYDKKECKLTINEEEAETVRLIFRFYAEEGLGLRRIAHKLYELGCLSRNGGEISALTIKNIITNPKYKGWYCGNKSRSVNYRTKKSVLLNESEWVCKPDNRVPALVSEELWEKANQLYKRRSEEAKEHNKVTCFHNEYAYSGKIYCEEHGTAFYRQMMKTRQGSRELWQCKIYRQKGRVACKAPQLYTDELNKLLSYILQETINKESLINTVLILISKAYQIERTGRELSKLEAEEQKLSLKRLRLIELNLEDSISREDYTKLRENLEKQLRSVRLKLQEQQTKQDDCLYNERLSKIRAALETELDFTAVISSELAAAILDHMVVKKDSTKAAVNLEIYLKTSEVKHLTITREKVSQRLSCS